MKMSRPSGKEAAEGRVAERNDELAPLQTKIAERERTRPLSERIKEIFKNGVTLTCILLAVTIRAVVGSITNDLKATGKALGNGQTEKDIGGKIGSMLPGLIGSIVIFLLKTAGQAIGFLSEHTCLLILATKDLLFEKYIKKRR